MNAPDASTMTSKPVRNGHDEPIPARDAVGQTTLACISRDGLRRYRVVTSDQGWRITRSTKTGNTVSLRNRRADSPEGAMAQLALQVIEDLQTVYSPALAKVRAARDHALRGRRPGFRVSPAQLERQFTEAMNVFAACCRDIALEWERMLAHAGILTDGQSPEVTVPIWLQEILDDLRDERALSAPTPSDPQSR